MVEIRALWRWSTPAPPDSFGIGNRPDRQGVPPLGGSDYETYDLVQPSDLGRTPHIEAQRVITAVQ